MVLMCLQQKPGIRSHVALRYVRCDGRQRHQTGCSDISVGAMTERKAVQQRIRYCMRV